MTAVADSAPRSVLVAGAINTDLVARVANAPEAGETVTGSTFAIFGGGKGANQAIAAARSGVPTSMFGALGDDDFGRQRRADLDAEGIDTESTARSTTAASGVALIVVEEETGQNRISYVPGATMTLTPEQARAAVDRVCPGVVLTTLEPPPQTLDALLAAANEVGATIVLNATPEAVGAKPLLERIAVLIVNETEAEDLLGYQVSAANGEEAARSLEVLGPGTVVITLGAAGAAVAHDGKVASFPAPLVDVIDTTGAGDAFCGAFAADLARGLDPFSAARTGVAAGSLATTVPGAYPGIPSRDAIQRMLGASERPKSRLATERRC